MDTPDFSALGLTNKDSEVYLFLLKNGSALANQIAVKTSIPRSSVYDYLNNLIERGVVSYAIVGGKKYFQATSPEKIFEKFEELKIRQAEKLKLTVGKLSKLGTDEHSSHRIEVFEGFEGVKTALNQTLRGHTLELMIYGSSGIAQKSLRLFLEQWNKTRVKQGIKMRIIYNDTPGLNERLYSESRLTLSKIKVFPIENFSLTGTIISHDSVLIVHWQIEDLFAIIIESKEVVKTYTNNFEILWGAAKEYSPSKTIS